MKFVYKKIVLYNREELLDTLMKPYVYNDDTLVLLCYEKWGVKSFNTFNGDFAFVLYDDTKREYIATRDILGIKALYYLKYNKKYYFSNDIDVLHDLSGIQLIPNIKSVKSFLQNTEIDYEATMYRDIYRVPPAHYVTIRDDTIKLYKYWFPEKITIDYDTPLEDTLEPFKRLFQKAIDMRVKNHSETAYELSGGLDSSSIVSMQKTKYPNENVDTYSMSFKGMSCDEYAYVKSLEEAYTFKTKNVDVSAMDFQRQYDFEFNYKMSPHWPIVNTFTMYFPMAEIIRQANKNVIITGQGGDNLLEGHCEVISDLLLRKNFKKLYSEIKALKKGRFFYALRCGVWPLFTKQQKNIIKYLLFRGKKVERIDIKDLFSLENSSSECYVRNMHALVSASQSTNLDGNIFHVIEKNYNVEMRHPFYDKKLIEYILSLPSEYKYSQGYIKIILRHAMKDILPEQVRKRWDKAEFSDVLIMQLDSLDLDVLFSQSELLRLSLLRKNDIKNLMKNYHNKKNIVDVWTVVNIEYWLQKSLKI